jgi:hypothetical protein
VQATHASNDAGIEALTVDVSELHEQVTKPHIELCTLMTTHAREMKHDGKLEKPSTKEIDRAQQSAPGARRPSFASSSYSPNR